MGIGGGGGRMCSPGWMRRKQQEERTAATLLGRGGRRYPGDRSGLVAGDVVFSHADLSTRLLSLTATRAVYFLNFSNFYFGCDGQGFKNRRGPAAPPPSLSSPPTPRRRPSRRRQSRAAARTAAAGLSVSTARSGAGQGAGKTEQQGADDEEEPTMVARSGAGMHGSGTPMARSAAPGGGEPGRHVAASAAWRWWLWRPGGRVGGRRAASAAWSWQRGGGRGGMTVAAATNGGRCHGLAAALAAVVQLRRSTPTILDKAIGQFTFDIVSKVKIQEQSQTTGMPCAFLFSGNSKSKLDVGVDELIRGTLKNEAKQGRMVRNKRSSHNSLITKHETRTMSVSYETSLR
uniref:Uncharacterized protein n=1 Tax=Oryza rufipogon TaxID=4529 RepID=A0A0E0N8V9_ORYRU